MKKVVILLLILLFSVGLQAQQKQNGLQVSIDDAIVQFIKTNNLCAINQLEDSLNHSKPNQYTIYWLAYIKLQKGMCFMRSQPDSAKAMLADGIRILSDKGTLNTEDYALLAYLQCMSIRFVSGMEAGILSKKAKTNARKAIQVDDSNVRGWFVCALLDYYTPIQFGGRKHCEEYWLKILSFPANAIPNQYLPTWGREDTYVMLLTYYKQTGNSEKLLSFGKRAHFEFPESELFKKYAQQTE